MPGGNAQIPARWWVRRGLRGEPARRRGGANASPDSPPHVVSAIFLAMHEPHPAATSSHGAFIQPRRFEFANLAAVPEFWFADNPIVTYIENAFSILIPPGERFFIRSVRHFADRTRDPELTDLVRAFVQQEGLHMRAHNEFNASLQRWGVDVDREIAYAESVFAWIEKWVPAKVQLGMTVFLEHITATGAHTLFVEPVVAASMHPEALRFWRWHAVEELEHKAVAFDLFRDVGGGYLLRVFSAVTAVLLLARPFDRIARRILRQSGRRVTAEDRRAARRLHAKVIPAQLRIVARYFLPGFHPNDVDDRRHLAEWYAAAV